MAGRLTTRVIDSVQGIPANRLLIDLFEWPPGSADRRHLKTVETNAEGVTEPALVEGEALHPATFELLYHTGRYFKSRGVASGDGLELDVVPVRFAITDATAAYCLSFVAGQRFFAVFSTKAAGG